MTFDPGSDGLARVTMSMMSDYSDHGVHRELDALESEHDRLRSLGKALLDVGDSTTSDTTRAELLDELGDLLAWHTRREEVGIFAELRSIDIPDEYLGLLQHSHHDIDDAFRDARSDRAGVPELVRRLEAHMSVEENDTFHVAHQLLTPSNWDSIERHVATVA
jgi:hypothetical protein